MAPPLFWPPGVLRRCLSPGRVLTQRTFLALLASAWLAGCESTPDLYAWGSYQQSVQRVAGPADAFDLQAEIARLTADMKQIADQQQRLPPGFALHLAYLHLLQGDRSRASALMSLEKAAFPESTHFIDGVMTRALNQSNLPAAVGQPGKQQ